MATTTENRYVGDGVTVVYAFTFPYIRNRDVKVSVDDVDLVNPTEYFLGNETSVSLTTAPAVGAAIRIYRDTQDDAAIAQFFPGSAIRARDLNDNFVQNLYVVQEASFASTAASSDAAAAKASADAAAQEAAQASADALQAQQDAANAAGLANSASTSATTASTAASNAEQSATDAGTLAASAASDAQAALAAVSQVIPYTPVSNVSSIPASPSDGDGVQVVDSTGIEGFTPLTGVPAGFVGDPGLFVRLIYSVNTWEWLDYGANDPESRYLPYDISSLPSLP